MQLVRCEQRTYGSACYNGYVLLNTISRTGAGFVDYLRMYSPAATSSLQIRPHSIYSGWYLQWSGPRNRLSRSTKADPRMWGPGNHWCFPVFAGFDAPDCAYSDLMPPTWFLGDHGVRVTDFQIEKIGSSMKPKCGCDCDVWSGATSEQRMTFRGLRI